MWVENHPFVPDPNNPPLDPNEQLGPPLQPAQISLRVTTDLLSLTALQTADGSEPPSDDLSISEYLGLTIHRPEDDENTSNLGLSDFFKWDSSRLSVHSIDKGFEIKGTGGPKWVGQYYAVLQIFRWKVKSPVETINEFS